MELRRLVQTTLVHPLRPEYSVATLFVPADLPEGIALDALSRSLGIEPISGGAISEAELSRVLVCLLSGSFEVFDMAEQAFRHYVNKSDITTEFLDEVQNKAHVLFEREHAVRDSLSAVLGRSFGASLGTYSVPARAALHDTSGAPHVELLSLIGSSGVLICGSVLGLDRALHFGLYERIYQGLLAPGAGPGAAP
jgi:hypothetical protein